jgi:hypothetical protein
LVCLIEFGCEFWHRTFLLWLSLRFLIWFLILSPILIWRCTCNRVAWISYDLFRIFFQRTWISRSTSLCRLDGSFFISSCYLSRLYRYTFPLLGISKVQEFSCCQRFSLSIFGWGWCRDRSSWEIFTDKVVILLSNVVSLLEKGGFVLTLRYYLRMLLILH